MPCQYDQHRVGCIEKNLDLIHIHLATEIEVGPAVKNGVADSVESQRPLLAFT